jgi:hypothetical protein
MQHQRLPQLPPDIQLRILSHVLTNAKTDSTKDPTADIHDIESGDKRRATRPTVIRADEQTINAVSGVLPDLILKQLTREGYAVVDGLFSEELLSKLLATCKVKYLGHCRLYFSNVNILL